MPSEGLLLGIAQIAVVVAGFTAVTSALTPPGGAWSPDHRLRQRAIVSTSFNVAFESLLPVIAFAWFGDARSALILSSVAVALYAGWVVVTRARQFLKTDAIHTRSGQLLMALGPPRVAPVRGKRRGLRVGGHLRDRAVHPATGGRAQLLLGGGGGLELMSPQGGA